MFLVVITKTAAVLCQTESLLPMEQQPHVWYNSCYLHGPALDAASELDNEPLRFRLPLLTVLRLNVSVQNLALGLIRCHCEKGRRGCVD